VFGEGGNAGGTRWWRKSELGTKLNELVVAWWYLQGGL